ncbi:hypothetical protein [Desulfatirhabdium butyrativorans]|uniref:hypothetical protein n=1 Tax=Desulfatirhabdium butyrativorans TaxID=340467 RepID=UPI000420B1DE|nr:hypothetical protein [Desulfatirhabdium butyrativorans]
MNPIHSIQRGGKFEIQQFKKPGNILELKKTHVSFTGTPMRHPYDPARVLLIVDMLSVQAYCYEFFVADIAFAEELPAIVTPEGDALTTSRIWVKKGTIGMRITPFVVEDMREALFGRDEP